MIVLLSHRISFLCLFDLLIIFSPIGSSWTTAIKELVEHYAQREASYPVLKQVILENLKKLRNEKIDEHNKVEICLFLFHIDFYDLIGIRFYSMMKK